MPPGEKSTGPQHTELLFDERTVKPKNRYQTSIDSAKKSSGTSQYQGLKIALDSSGRKNVNRKSIAGMWARANRPG